MSRVLIEVLLTEVERDVLIECINYQIGESDRRNKSGIPADQKRRTGKFQILAEVRNVLAKAAQR